jgi:hypothetical protein
MVETCATAGSCAVPGLYWLQQTQPPDKFNQTSPNVFASSDLCIAAPLHATDWVRRAGSGTAQASKVCASKDHAHGVHTDLM